MGDGDSAPSGAGVARPGRRHTTRLSWSGDGEASGMGRASRRHCFRIFL